jgi:hypothetical protein
MANCWLWDLTILNGRVSKVVIEGSQDSREMTENDLKVINEKVIAVLRIV